VSRVLSPVDHAYCHWISSTSPSSCLPSLTDFFLEIFLISGLHIFFSSSSVHLGLMISIPSALLPPVFPLSIYPVHSCQFNLKLIHSHFHVLSAVKYHYQLMYVSPSLLWFSWEQDLYLIHFLYPHYPLECLAHNRHSVVEWLRLALFLRYIIF